MKLEDLGAGLDSQVTKVTGGTLLVKFFSLDIAVRDVLKDELEYCRSGPAAEKGYQGRFAKFVVTRTLQLVPAHLRP